MSKRIEDLRILENKRISDDVFILQLSSDNGIPELLPGQFAQVRVDDSPETFLRRPISFHDVDYENNTFKLLIQIVGKGTERLSKHNKGDLLSLIYPLGNSFSLPGENDKILLTGGGVGVAPLLFMGKYLKSKGYNYDILLGFRNSKRIIEIEEYRKIGKVFLITEDGSEGEKGYITNHSALLSGNYNKVYCCGPDPMMKAVAAHCRKNNLNCEVSLENLMGCGIGACLCCIVDTIKGNLCSCIDGPVFNTNELKW
jgi:dihydroorotate dehydrogenase electron transfer subunit